MLLGQQKSTEDCVTEALFSKSLAVVDLHQILNQKYSKNITPQALYRTLKRLVNEGVVVKSGVLFTINAEWVQNVVTFFSNSESLSLGEGESISYSFLSLSALDAYWKHIVAELSNLLKDAPIFFYNNHVIWLHLEGRKENQESYLNSFDLENKHAFFVVGGNTQADQDFKKNFNRQYLRVELRSISSIKYDSVTVYGDYIVTVKFKKRTTDFVNRLYKECKTDKDFEEGLKKSLEARLSVTLVIKKDKKKAYKLRQILSKNFYVPSSLKYENEL